MSWDLKGFCSFFTRWYNTLSVRCVMWKGEGNAEQIVAQTRIITENISFFHTVEKLSEVKRHEPQETEIGSTLNKNIALSSTLHIIGKRITIDIIPEHTNGIIHESKIHLRGKSGYIECGGANYGDIAAEIRAHVLSLSLTMEDVLKRRSEYLSDDRMVFLCQCAISTGIASNRVEKTHHALSSAGIKQKFFGYPSALDDMKALYLSQHLTDVELKTNTKSFPAHKNVLCARSPVFKAMMITDMKEKNTACIPVDDMKEKNAACIPVDDMKEKNTACIPVDVTEDKNTACIPVDDAKEKNTACIPVDDLDDDSVEQLLLFLYSDSVKDLRCKSAAQLYCAANKYQIGKLKTMCSSFLEENLNVYNAGELLLLADTHNDCDLQKKVEDFIMKNEEEVFGSDEWEKLTETNPLLAMKKMHLKCKKRKVN